MNPTYRAIEEFTSILLSVYNRKLDSTKQLVPFIVGLLSNGVEIEIRYLVLGILTSLVTRYEGHTRPDKNCGRLILSGGLK